MTEAAPPPTLADLTQQLTELVYMEEHLDAQTYSDTLEGVEGAFEVKAEKVVYAIRGIERRAQLMKDQARRFRERIAVVESNAEYLRGYLKHALEFANKKLLETPAFTIRLRASTAVTITSEDEVPTQLLRTTTSTAPDKVAIGKQLKAGEEVPGCELEHRTTLLITGADDGELE
jgi:hypothetical protein